MLKQFGGGTPNGNTFTQQGAKQIQVTSLTYFTMENIVFQNHP